MFKEKSVANLFVKKDKDVESFTKSQTTKSILPRKASKKKHVNVISLNAVSGEDVVDVSKESVLQPDSHTPDLGQKGQVKEDNMAFNISLANTHLSNIRLADTPKMQTLFSNAVKNSPAVVVTNHPLAKKKQKKFPIKSSAKPKAKSQAQSLAKLPGKGTGAVVIKTPNEYFLAFCKYYKHHFIDIEVSFVMNKLSIASIVCGLMVLGGLFFGSGFFLATKIGFQNPIIITNQTQGPLPVKKSAHKSNHPPSPYALLRNHQNIKQPPVNMANRYQNRSGVVMQYPKHVPSGNNFQ